MITKNDNDDLWSLNERTEYLVRSDEEKKRDAEALLASTKETILVGSRPSAARKVVSVMKNVFNTVALASILGAVTLATMSSFVPAVEGIASMLQTSQQRTSLEFRHELSKKTPAIVINKIKHYGVKDNFKDMSWAKSNQTPEQAKAALPTAAEAQHQFVIRTVDVNSENLNEVEYVIDVSEDLYNSYCLQNLATHKNKTNEITDCVPAETPLSSINTDFAAVNNMPQSMMFIRHYQAKEGKLKVGIPTYKIAEISVPVKSELYVGEDMTYDQVTKNGIPGDSNFEAVYHAVELSDSNRINYKYITSYGDAVKNNEASIKYVNGTNVHSTINSDSLFYQGSSAMDTGDPFGEASSMGHIQSRDEWEAKDRATTPLATIGANVNLYQHDLEDLKTTLDASVQTEAMPPTLSSAKVLSKIQKAREAKAEQEAQAALSAGLSSTVTPKI